MKQKKIENLGKVAFHVSVDGKMENQNVNYFQQGDTVGFKQSADYIDYDWYRQTWYPYYQPYYETYPVYIKDKDSFEKAFAVAKLLLKKNLLNSKKLKDFISLVEDIAKVL